MGLSEGHIFRLLCSRRNNSGCIKVGEKKMFRKTKATVDHAPDMPRESVHRSSPLTPHGLIAPPGLHGFEFQEGAGMGRWHAKTMKKH